MTIVFEKGDLFDVEADVIAHGANCRGVMGAGIAVQFKKRFPLMYQTYVNECGAGTYVPGDIMPFSEVDQSTNNHVVGVNLFTQENPGADATGKAVLVSLILVSQKLGRVYGGTPTVLAMPLIGCGIGGLTFPEFFAKVYQVAQIFPEINYKIVYNDSNEDQIPASIRDAQWA